MDYTVENLTKEDAEYDPEEDPGWRIGNSNIMAEIRELSRDEALQHILRLYESRELQKRSYLLQRYLNDHEEDRQ